MTTTGIVGGTWRATVTPWGAIEPWDGSAVIDWHVAADDRWHSPKNEASIRQSRLDGTPVVETKLRIPSGDAIHRVYSAAVDGGCTVIEITNDSPLPIAVAFTRADLLSPRPPTDVPIEGIDLPADSITFPIGHRATIAVALSHRSGVTAMPQVPPFAQIVRGWTAQVQVAGQLELPDQSWTDSVSAARSELLLVGPGTGDLAERVLGLGQLGRLHEPADNLTVDMVTTVEQLLRQARNAGGIVTAVEMRALWSAARFFHGAGERRAVDDTLVAISRLRVAEHAPSLASPAVVSGDPTHELGAELRSPARVIDWVESWIAQITGQDSAMLIPQGFPSTWLGVNFDVQGLPVGLASTVSFAIRWHGDRPAVLWECAGQRCALSGPDGWSTVEMSGEALWTAPPRSQPQTGGELDNSSGDVSFN